MQQSKVNSFDASSRLEPFKESSGDWPTFVIKKNPEELSCAFFSSVNQFGRCVAWGGVVRM